MPTVGENQKFYGSSTNNGATSTWKGGTSGSTTLPGYRILGAGTGNGGILPAAGIRGSDGSGLYIGQSGYYWSSTLTDDSYGSNFISAQSSVAISSGANMQSGRNVRCVHP